jgi:regulator of RNase E activity RraA
MSPRASDPRLDDVTSATLCDAMEELYGHTAHVRDLITPTPGRVLYGPACTMRLVPVRGDAVDSDLHSFRRVFYEAVPEPRRAQVLVVDTSGHFDTAVAGALEAARLDEHDLAGLLVDGRLRDWSRVGDLPLSVWCRGRSPDDGDDELMAVAANVPAVVGDATILPGDWIYADGGGAVALPEEALDDVLDRAVEIGEDREAAEDEVRREDPEAILAASGDEGPQAAGDGDGGA